MYFCYLISRFSKITTPGHTGLCQEVFNETNTDIVAHLLKLLINLSIIVFVVRTQLRHDCAICECDEFSIDLFHFCSETCQMLMAVPRTKPTSIICPTSQYAVRRSRQSPSLLISLSGTFVSCHTHSCGRMLMISGSCVCVIRPAPQEMIYHI